MWPTPKTDDGAAHSLKHGIFARDPADANNLLYYGYGFPIVLIGAGGPRFPFDDADPDEPADDDVLSIHHGAAQLILLKRSPLQGDEVRFLRLVTGIGFKELESLLPLRLTSEWLKRWESRKPWHPPISHTTELLFRLLIAERLGGELTDQVLQIFGIAETGHRLS